MNPAAASSPYPGPRPFRPDESASFVGRECDSRDLFSLITAYDAVLLYAQSGAGKTSLINAGLIPLLRTEEFDVLPPARVFASATDRVDASRIKNIFTYSVALHWLPDPADTLEKATLTEVLARVPRAATSDEPRVMIFDQFEEFFTIHLDRWREREPFFEQLGELLDNDPLARAVFVLREDYLAQIEPFANQLTRRLRTRMRLERLSEDAALRAVTEPLASTGRHFAPGVAEELIKDLLKIKVEVMPGKTITAIGQYVEPVQLQVVCQSLWRTLKDHETTIRSEHLSAIGDIDKVLSSFYEDALSAAAEKAGIEEVDLRNWFEKTLITSMGTRGTVYRGPETTGNIENAAIDELEERHLIRAEWRASARWYELTHDRFIEPIRLSNAASLERRRVEVYDLVTQAQAAWQRDDKKEALKLFRQALNLANAASPSIQAYIGYMLGALCIEMNRLDDAALVLQDAARLYKQLNNTTELAEVLGLLGLINHQRQQFDAAVTLLSEAIDLHPTRLQFYARRGSALWYAGDLRRAIRDLDVVLEHEPEDAYAYNSRGHVYSEAGEFEKGVADLNQVLRLASPTHEPLLVAYALNGLGLAHGGLRRWKEAAARFDASLRLAPDNGWVFFNRARVNHWKGDEKHALDDLRLSLEKKDPALNPLKRAQAESILAGHPWPS